MPPHRLMRYIILGERERVLASRAIWTCIQCITCSIRCPNGIDIARVFESLRDLSVREQKRDPHGVWFFDELFLRSVEKHGRLHELEAVLKYKGLSGGSGEDRAMGLAMLLKGRMGVLPRTIKGAAQIREIFRKAREKKIP